RYDSHNTSRSVARTSASSHDVTEAPEANGCPPPLYLFAKVLIAGPFERIRARIKYSSSIKMIHALTPWISPSIHTHPAISVESTSNLSSISCVTFTETAPDSDNS